MVLFELDLGGELLGRSDLLHVRNDGVGVRTSTAWMHSIVGIRNCLPNSINSSRCSRGVMCRIGSIG